jgi:hypothetical protein
MPGVGGWHREVSPYSDQSADKMSIATLRSLMGHKRKETTLKYVHLARTNLRKEMLETAL